MFRYINQLLIADPLYSSFLSASIKQTSFLDPEYSFHLPFHVYTLVPLSFYFFFLVPLILLSLCFFLLPFPRMTAYQSDLMIIVMNQFNDF